MASTNKTTSGSKAGTPSKPTKTVTKKATPEAASAKATVAKAAAKSSAAAPATAKTAPARSTVASKPAAKQPAAKVISSEERHRLIAEAAYLLAEKRGFQGGSPEQDWFDAAAQVDQVIMGSNKGRGA